MIVAALVISILALVLATAAISIQITLWVSSRSAPKSTETFTNLGALRDPSPEELDSFFSGKPETQAGKVIREAKESKLEEAFENPDVPYTGIDEEFNV